MIQRSSPLDDTNTVPADEDSSTNADESTTDSSADGYIPSRTLLLSRIFVTWVELIVVGFAGTALGGVASGPPQLVVYLATTLASVGILLYNVDHLIRSRLSE